MYSKADLVKYTRNTYRYMDMVINIVKNKNSKLSNEDYIKIFEGARAVVGNNFKITKSLSKILDGVQTLAIPIGKKYAVRIQFDGGLINKVNIYDRGSLTVIKITRELNTNSVKVSEDNKNMRNYKYGISIEPYKVIRGLDESKVAI